MFHSRKNMLFFIFIGFSLLTSCGPGATAATQVGVPPTASAPTTVTATDSTPPTHTAAPTEEITLTPSEPTFVVPGGRILFGAMKISSEGGTEYEHFSWLHLPEMTLEAHPYLASSEQVRDYSPALSPDFSHLAFAHQTFATPGTILLLDGTTAVHFARPDDAQATPVGEPFRDDYIPFESVNGDGISWSGNGQVFAFVRQLSWQKPKTEKPVYLYDVPSNALKTLMLPAYTAAFALSPDGTELAFTRFGLTPGISVISTDGSNQRLLTEGWVTSNLAWHPDGSRLFFVMDKPPLGIYSVDTTTGTLTQVTTRAEEPFQVTISPDGSSVVYQDHGLWIVPAEGGEPVKLLKDAPGWHDWVWSPDGQYMAYTAPPDPSIFIMDRLGNGMVEVYRDELFRVPQLIGWLP